MPPVPAEYPPKEYSKLDLQTEAPPPRPPKPLQLRASSQPPEAITSSLQPSTEQRPFSQIYSDDIIVPTSISVAPPPPSNIYNTMEGSPAYQPHPPGKHYYHVLEGPTSEGVGPATTEPRPEPRPAKLVDQESERSLFDDPEYSQLNLASRGGGGEREAEGEGGIEVIDPRYAGNYERAPTYELPKVTLPASEVDPKYLGDYERDPAYIPPPPPRKTSEGEGPRPPQPPRRRQSLGAVDVVRNYSGDYERDPAYQPPLQRRHSSKDKELVHLRRCGSGRGQDKELVQLKRCGSGRGQDKELVQLRAAAQQTEGCDGGGGLRGEGGERGPLFAKYRGDYERDPEYMARLQEGRGTESTGTCTADYSYPQFGCEELVPPHIPSAYKTLEAALRDPPQQYARLTSDPPETTIASITTTV